MEKYAYVTGADRGLGLALTGVMLENGYTVFAGSYMDWHELPRLKKTHDKSLRIIPLDVTEPKSVKEAAEEIKKHTDKLDILVNNAGIYKEKTGTIFEELDFDEMVRMYQTNALGPLRVTHSVISLLARGDGKKLVNISSEAGSCSQTWRIKEYGYSMSKAALNKQSVILQNHLKEYGIKVFAVHPGWLRTYMLGRLDEEAEVEPEDSAQNIYRVIEKNDDLDGPIFMDYRGNTMEW